MVTFDLSASNVIRQIIEAACPENFNYGESYSLLNQAVLHDVTGSIRTLTILSISASSTNLYTELFQDWEVADKSPLTFHRANLATVTFCSDWTIRVRFGIKDEEVFEVSKSDTFVRLKSYLQ